MEYSYSKELPEGKYLQGGYLCPVNVESVETPEGETVYRFYLLKFKEPPTQEQIDRYLSLGADVQRHSEKCSDWLERLPMREEIADALPELTVGGILATELSSAELAAILEHYPEYEIGRAYTKDEVFRYESKLWRVAQAHASQAGWVPGSVPALYVEIAPPGVVPEWVQPTGAHDAYQIGDRVIFDGIVYESLINANVWSPAAYPAGWRAIG
jgi:hypothetical protein